MDIKPTAMILAAGRGTRMRATAADPPKPLTPFRGQTLLDIVLARLVDAGVEKIIINLHHKADRIKAHLAAHRAQYASAAEIIVSDEYDCLRDTGGGVKYALPLLGPAPFLVCNADSVWLEDKTAAPALAALIAAFAADKMDALLLVASRNTALGYEGAGDFYMDNTNRLHRRTTGAPETMETAEYIFAGAQMLTPDIFADVDDEVFSLNRIYDIAATRQRLYGTRLCGRFLHIGTPEALAAAQASFSQ